MPAKLFFYITLLVILFPKPVYAYLDPGTGSYLFQILIAGVLGSLFFVKSIFRRVKGFLKRIFKKNKVANKGHEDR